MKFDVYSSVFSKNGEVETCTFCVLEVSKLHIWKQMKF